ncbi:hypothetical protein NQ317_011315 [Molorchus minor]|uniref:Lipase domain-containing protein n=1 Tax=Molorchus minor TaxID=1323400 RepID=A0ABQ9IZR2_9CUCU|nr:hypothetical protein NQ317_011315 [Molorchus minor]
MLHIDTINSICLHLATLEDIKDLSVSQLLQLADDISHTTKTDDVKGSDITYFLFTSNDVAPIIIDEKTKGTIDFNKPTKLIIHGWIATNRRSWNKRMAVALLKRRDVNVIQVNWERPARKPYVSSAVDTKIIGYNIAQFIIDSNVPLENIHLIGHSLGAHVAGFAAKKIKELTGEKIGRISGLEPAGPYFREYILVKQERLDQEDANVVDVIHTDAGVYGIEFPVGTLDIYVNGGKAPQPGCLHNVDSFQLGYLIEHSYCSHEIKWINGGKFHCRLCKIQKDLLVQGCNKTVVFGEEDVDEELTGVCFAKSRSSKPFLWN